MLVGWHFRPLVVLKPPHESKLGEFVLGPCVRFSFASLLIKLVLIFNTKIDGSHFDLLLFPYASQLYDLF